MITVHFTTRSHSETVALFTREAEYLAALPALEAEAKAARCIVTEAEEEAASTLNVRTSNPEEALVAVGRAFPNAAFASRYDDTEGVLVVCLPDAVATPQAISWLASDLRLEKVAYRVGESVFCTDHPFLEA